MVFNFPSNFPNPMEDSVQMSDSTSCLTHLKIQVCFSLSLRVITTEITNGKLCGAQRTLCDNRVSLSSLKFIFKRREVKTTQTNIFLTNLTFHFHGRCGFSCFRLSKFVMWSDTPKCTQTLQNIITDPNRVHLEQFLMFF